MEVQLVAGALRGAEMVDPGQIIDVPKAEAERMVEDGVGTWPSAAIETEAEAERTKAVEEAVAAAKADAETERTKAVEEAVAAAKADAETERTKAVEEAVAAAKADAETEKEQAVEHAVREALKNADKGTAAPPAKRSAPKTGEKRGGATPPGKTETRSA